MLYQASHSKFHDTALVLPLRPGKLVRGFPVIRSEQLVHVLHDDIYGYILHAGHVILPLARTFVDAAGMAFLRRLDENVPAIIGIEGRHGARAEHRDNRDVHGDTNMHGAGIRREEQAAAPQEPSKHRQTDLAREDMDARALALLHLCHAFVDDGHVSRAAEKGDVIAAADEPVGTGGKIAVEPAFRQPTRADVEGHNLGIRPDFLLPEALRFRFGFRRQPHLKAAVIDGLDADGLSEHIEVTEHLMLDLVLRRIRHGAVRQYLVEEPLEARLRITDNAFAAREGRNSRSPLIAMEIDHEVEMAPADLVDEAQEGQQALVPAVFVDEDAFVDVLVAAHEVAERLIREQRDMRLRVIRPERPERRRHQHEVTNVHRIDDQDILIHEKPFLLPDD